MIVSGAAVAPPRALVIRRRRRRNERRTGRILSSTGGLCQNFEFAGGTEVDLQNFTRLLSFFDRLMTRLGALDGR